MSNAMRKSILVLLTAVLCLPAFSQESSGPLSLIPEPVSQQVAPGRFNLPTTVLIEAPGQPELVQTLTDLKTRLSTPTGYTVNISHESSTSAAIRLVLNK